MGRGGKTGICLGAAMPELSVEGGRVEAQKRRLGKHSASGQRSRGFQEGSEQEGPAQRPGLCGACWDSFCCFCFLNFTQILEIINPMLWGGVLQFVFFQLFLHSH